MNKEEFKKAVREHSNNKRLLTAYTMLPGQTLAKDRQYFYGFMDEMHPRDAVIDSMFERLKEVYPDGIEDVIAARI